MQSPDLKQESSEVAQIRSRCVASFQVLSVLNLRLEKMKKLVLGLWNLQFVYLYGILFACRKALAR
jgi:hypothetical protein